jgi:hypothetical protein
MELNRNYIIDSPPPLAPKKGGEPGGIAMQQEQRKSAVYMVTPNMFVVDSTMLQSIAQPPQKLNALS